MRDYKVYLRDKDGNCSPEPVHITAEDVDVEQAVESDAVGVAYFNFFGTKDKGGSQVTVAVVPFDEVAYITS